MDRVLERAQGESFFLTRKIAKMHQAILDIFAQRIAAALSNSQDVDTTALFSETLSQMIAEPVAATLRCIEHTRDALTKAIQSAAASSKRGVPEDLPRPSGMPMLDVHEFSQTIVIEKPRLLLLLGQGAVASKIRRQLEQQYDRALLEFLSLTRIVCAAGWSKVLMPCAPRLTRLLTCVAPTLAPHLSHPVCPRNQRFKMIFGFCVNGTQVMSRP
jgi:hypothetical protein